MEWLSDYLRFCLEHGFGGVALLVLSAGALLLAALFLLTGVAKAAQAFGRGWGQGAS